MNFSGKPCENTAKYVDRCSGWKINGECEANPSFMLTNCPAQCNINCRSNGDGTFSYGKDPSFFNFLGLLFIGAIWFLVTGLVFAVFVARKPTPYKVATEISDMDTKPAGPADDTSTLPLAKQANRVIPMTKFTDTTHPSLNQNTGEGDGPPPTLLL